MISEFSKFKGFSLKNLPEVEPIAPGHRGCQGCGEILALRMAMKALGTDVIVANATGCMEIITSPFPHTSWRVPWIHTAFENTAAVASGIEAALKVLKRRGRFPKSRHVDVVAVAGDGGTADIGLQALSGALERGHDFVYICLDNEAYMNTGVQRSSATPYGAMTTTSPPGERSFGQMTWKKNVPQIAVAHGIPYVATASPAFFLDLMNKVKRAALVKGPAYVHIYSPCPTGWGSRGEDSIKIARLAVDTKVFPLYEVIEGKYYITRKITKPKPVEEYLKTQRRFRHLTPEVIAEIQRRVDAEYERLLKLAEI
ncbi:thiamine pyrophosphate TPP-binding domain-containing protein [Thermodesulfatator indicus DSM 15286]|uniref:Thiamine pyrophosphate TPP-binding domain-containing protein n=1 Tax=Thermodesulfatator indicus (strain DSM 15286 / JCM 11887 / CIR29812) TaxID=667014 RepID=F8AA01_THEID|nr:pyruvate synthase subunit PorB [Thermodesulfatator indicus]AEH45287.1 thiamine pyrophosphate TPP-binding domain-containing protein [Thermodesulfatator indicus DSM 15286]